MRGIDYYQLLGVAEDASAAEIKSAYRALVRSTHPDTGGNENRFQRLRDAYETLYDPALRARYDRMRKSSEPARASTTGTALRDRRTRRRRFGEDPWFVATLPYIPVDNIAWWRRVDPRQPAYQAGEPTPGHAPLVVVFGGLLVLLIPVALPVEFVTVLAMWLLIALVAGGVSFWFARRLLGLARAERAFAAEFGTALVHGQVGSEHDQWSERLTAELLEGYLTRLPGARIFHGLSLPGSVFADIDHAVLCGGRLVLIESKAWLPGYYATQPDGTLSRNGQRFRGGATGLDEAVVAYRELLPDTEVRGALVIYPNREGEVTTMEASTTVTAPMTPERFVRDIGAWLAADPATVDVPAFRAVLANVV